MATKVSKSHSESTWLLPGEKVVAKESNIGYLHPVGKIMGSLTVTNYRLCFQSAKSESQSHKELELFVPLGYVSRVEKIGYAKVSRVEDSYGLELHCKDFRNLKFVSKQENHSRRPLFESLQKYAFPLSNGEQLFAFQNQQRFTFEGWTLYDTVRDLKRLGIPNENWAITDINRDYQFADTYPRILCVPKKALEKSSNGSGTSADDFMHRVGSFRSKARIPVLCWINQDTQASLTRCSQPMVGMTARRCPEDEQYLQMIIDANAQSPKLYIMDARPDVNAKVNKAKGGGYESDEAYGTSDLVFLDIQNIHVMRESLRKLKDICYPKVDEKNWLSLVDDTHWLEHIRLIMHGAVRVVDKLENHKTSVLVHCSDGWDRTAQLTALAQLMLDGYYRTLDGFQVLIEKEWCSFGHKFAHRVGHGESKHDDAERSPVFLQFVDCVWQMTQQFPTCMEFNNRFLLTVVDELYSNRFGTFLHNSEKERRDMKLKETTKSLWSLIAEDRDAYLNPHYNQRTRDHVLIPNCSQRRIKLWKEYYLRYNPFVNTMANSEFEDYWCRRLLAIRNGLQAEYERLLKEQAHHSAAGSQVEQRTLV